MTLSDINFTGNWVVITEIGWKTGLHIWEDHFLVEIVDPEGYFCTPGKRGELVLTSLTKEAMPLIRYHTGDVTFMNAPRAEIIIDTYLEAWRYNPASKNGEITVFLLDVMENSSKISSEERGWIRPRSSIFSQIQLRYSYNFYITRTYAVEVFHNK